MPLIYNLKEELDVILPKATDVKIAVALAKYTAFNNLRNLIKPSIPQSYILGIDLPTDYEVFETLFKEKVNSRVYIYTDKVFHPKVYILELGKTLTAYISSANLTDAGFVRNEEVTYKTENDEEIKNLIEWYNQLYNESNIIDENFLKKYKERNKDKKIEDAENKRTFFINGLKNEFGKSHYKDMDEYLREQEIDITKFNYSDQFFKLEHYLAFEDHKIKNVKFNDERHAVVQKFLELHEAIYNQFKSYSLNSLNAHYKPRYITSLFDFAQTDPRALTSIWLHYGKSKKELDMFEDPNEKRELRRYNDNNEDDQGSFINHIRIQCYLRKNCFGISLFIGKPNGSLWDRDNLRKILKNTEDRKKLLDILRELNGDYWINYYWPNTEEKYLFIHKSTEEQIIKFLQIDDDGSYFSIGKEFSPDNFLISTKNISQTILKEFQLLYPLYELIKKNI
ncbi:MAG: NgoFVII family restriction endonuclease [Bacteroidetes bacterium]|nr:NgoFVII family restriction endonuclease [Bacteroidota bacterium]